MIDMNRYGDFVEQVTSEASNNTDTFIEHIKQLEENSDYNVALLNTVAVGLPAEAGEFSDIVKKVLFHGKPVTEEVHDELRRELGDVMWYWINGCRAIGVDPFDIIQQNFDKLSARYPEGTFSIERSENRAEDDK